MDGHRALKHFRRFDAELLEVSDLIRVRPGERFPIDGNVIEGESWVDESRLTGESHLPLRLGVMGHEGSTVIVVLNGLRILWEKVPNLNSGELDIGRKAPRIQGDHE